MGRLTKVQLSARRACHIRSSASKTTITASACHAGLTPLTERGCASTVGDRHSNKVRNIEHGSSGAAMFSGVGTVRAAGAAILLTAAGVLAGSPAAQAAGST